MLNIKQLREGIRLALVQFETYVKYSVKQDMTDINRYAEDFYCELLNKAFGWELRNLNQDNRNQPAIDLADDTNKIAVQVTSSRDRGKVTRTLKKFFEGKLDRKYQKLLMLVIGEEDAFAKDFTLERGFDFDPQRDIWDTPRLLGKLEGITDLDKLREICDYLQDQLGGYPFPRPLTPDLPLRTVLEGDAFVGRAEELAEIDRRFRSERVLFLTGLGGMGKTELAVRYAREFVEKRGHRAFLVLFRENLRETLLNNVTPTISGLDTKTLPESEILRRTVEALNSAGADALLILDNADQANLTALRSDLSALKLKVLVTTRQDEEGALDVARLHREELYRLFTQHEARVTREEMDALIDAVDGHTLTVDLMARALRPGFRAATAEKLLHNLGDGSVKKVKSAYRGREDQARINEHLRAVFRVLALSDEEKALLHFATLLPESGMDGELFLQPFEEDLGDSLNDLIQGGWLLWKDDLLRIHPVIRLVCIEELSPAVENCADFLRWFRGQYDRTTYDRVKFSQIAALYETASEVLQEKDGLWANEAGYLWLVLMESRRALTCNHRAVALREQNAPNSLGLATAYNNLGSTYGHLGDHKKELEYQLKDLAICEQVLPPTHPDLATSYNNVGGTYGDLGDHEKELEYQLKALAICEQVLPPTHPDLATSYNNVGTTYGDLGDHEKELEYQLKALAILEQVLPPTHPNLAASYNNVGSTYGDLGDHKKALEYKLKALAIREQVLSPNHPDLAGSYNNVGSTYGYLGDHEKELEYQLKALAIREQVLPPTHPSLATSYNNVGMTYGDLGDQAKALEYQLKALAIREQVLPPTHPDLAASYNNVGATYGDLGDQVKALEYQLKALSIQEQVLPPTHPSLAASYNNVGGTYGNLGDHEKALEYQLKSLGILEQSLPPDHPHNVMCRSNIAVTYARMEDFIRANEYMRRALDSAERSMGNHPQLEMFRRMAQIMEICAKFQEAGMPLPFDNPFR